MSVTNAEYEELKARFSAYVGTHDSEDVQRIQRGITLSTSLSNQQLRDFAKRVTLFTREPVDINVLREERFGLSESAYVALLQTFTFLAPPVGADEPVDALERAITEVLSLDIAQVSALNRLLVIIKSISPELKDTAEQASLTNETLPSFRRLDATVDVRLRRNDEGQVDLAVPVVICHLATDVTSQKVWFQLSKRSLLALRNTVESALKDVEAAEDYISARKSTR